MDREFESKTALVTGGGYGIGAPVSVLLASQGANVTPLLRSNARCFL